MLLLTAAVAAFLVTHIGLSSTPLRDRLAARLGEKGFLGLYSLIALLTLTGMILAYNRAAPGTFLWVPGPGLRHLPLLLMPVAFVFLVAGVITPNPTGVGMAQVAGRDDAVRGILRITRHPVQWAIFTWAAAHILANGDLASVTFFGGFLLLSALGTRLIDAKLARQQGADWRRFAERTSNLPFAAIVGGRNRLALGELGWKPIVGGLVLYVVVLHSHALLFGAAPY